MKTIDVKRLADGQSRSEIDVVDVRMSTEFREIHAECARNVPLDSLDHPYFVGLSAFIGAGLMFAGATGSCPMASGIAKMPWNQCEGGGSCSA